MTKKPKVDIREALKNSQSPHLEVFERFGIVEEIEEAYLKYDNVDWIIGDVKDMPKLFNKIMYALIHERQRVIIDIDPNYDSFIIRKIRTGKEVSEDTSH